ncbi:mitochondrial uncoupling protein 4-like isoform X2 [Bacillus rossius redtenbacheri]|uniref:mitochondrial uncoupling protein 4-like isoform X2 n=1 Tax=Bacillus rossius redtenbacheri TaxID=93214 RepID=UPI002FDD13E2
MARALLRAPLQPVTSEPLRPEARPLYKPDPHTAAISTALRGLPAARRAAAELPSGGARNYEARRLASTVTYPMDLVKTRLQLQGESLATEGTSREARRGLVRTAVGVVREEGLWALWRGLSPAIWRNTVYCGARVVIYQQLRDNLLSPDPATGAYPLWKSAANGLAAGVVAQFLANPADLVKVRMQAEGRRRLRGLPPRTESLLRALRQIRAEGGVWALWKGCVPNMQRAGLVTLGDLTAYDCSKRFLLHRLALGDNYVTHALASVLAGLAAAVMGSPADVVKARVMNQPTDERGRGLYYRSSTDCLLCTVRDEGVLALYKGFIPLWLRLAPWSLTFWLSYEQIKLLLGAQTF